LGGVDLFGWQRGVLDVALEVEAGRLARSPVTVVCPRRNGKTAMVIARALYGCLVLGENVTYTAHKFDTAIETFRAFASIVEETPALRRHRRHIYNTNGKERISFTNGANFAIRARTASGGRGLETDCLIMDEALELNADQMAALTPLLAKARAQGGGQIWFLSSAGHGRSKQLSGIRDRGRTNLDDTGSAYFEWAAPRGINLDDRSQWAAANPSLGTDILDHDFLATQRLLLDDEGFGREHLGWWTDEIAEPFLTPGMWEALVPDEHPELSDPAGIMLGLESDPAGTVAVVARPTVSGLWVERVKTWEPEAEPSAIAASVIAWCRKHRPTSVASDRKSSGLLVEHLRAARLPIRQLDYQAVVDATGLFVAEVRAGRIHHPGDPQLDEHIGNAGTKPAGDGYLRLSRTASTGPSAAAFAAVAAVWASHAPAPGMPSIVLPE
jgi:phage terminase large subunit-like protein